MIPFKIWIENRYGKEGFWTGDKGASGILPICTSTKRICLAWRSRAVHMGDCWGTIGGAIQGGSPEESAKTELKEETGYAGPIDLKPAYVFSKGSFKYYNFIGIVPNEFPFHPEHTWETDKIEWKTYEQILTEMQEQPNHFHMGIIALFKNSKNLIDTIIGHVQ